MSPNNTGINIGRPIAWMLDPTVDRLILGVIYEFTLSGEQVTVWYTDDGLPAAAYRKLHRLE